MMNEFAPNEKCQKGVDMRDENEIGGAILGSLCVYLCQYGTYQQSFRVRRFMNDLLAKARHQKEEHDARSMAKSQKCMKIGASPNDDMIEVETEKHNVNMEEEFDCHKLRQQLYHMIDSDDFLWNHAVIHSRVMVAPRMFIPPDRLDEILSINRKNKNHPFQKNEHISGDKRDFVESNKFELKTSSTDCKLPHKHEYFESYPTSPEWLLHVPDKYKTPDLVSKSLAFQKLNDKKDDKRNKSEQDTASKSNDPKKVLASLKFETVNKRLENIQNSVTSTDSSARKVTQLLSDKSPAKGKQHKRYATRGRPKKSQIDPKADDLYPSNSTIDNSKIEHHSNEDDADSPLRTTQISSDQKRKNKNSEHENNIPYYNSAKKNKTNGNSTSYI
jgi:hypothetical protein